MKLVLQILSKDFGSFIKTKVKVYYFQTGKERTTNMKKIELLENISTFRPTV